MWEPAISGMGSFSFKVAGKSFSIEPMKIYTFTAKPQMEFQIANKGITLFCGSIIQKNTLKTKKGLKMSFHTK